MGGEQVEPAVRLAHNRCPYCHDQVAAAESLACQSCLARHHPACWEELGRCASCDATQALRPDQAATQARAPAAEQVAHEFQPSEEFLRATARDEQRNRAEPVGAILFTGLISLVFGALALYALGSFVQQAAAGDEPDLLVLMGGLFIAVLFCLAVYELRRAWRRFGS